MLNKLVGLTQKFSPGLRQVIGNTSWLLTDKILQMAIGLLVGIWVARYLQPTEYGLLTYASTWVALFGTLTRLGLGSIIVRDIARDPSCKEETLGTAFVLQAIGGCLTLLLTVSTIYLLKPDETLTRSLVGIVAAGTIFQAFGTINYWFQSQLLSKYTVVATNVVSVINAVLRIVLIQLQATVIAFAWAKLAEEICKGIAFMIAYRINGNYLTAWRYSFLRAKTLLLESWPLILSGFTVYVYSKIDQIMLGSLLENTSQLGFYSVAVKFSEIFDFIPVIVAQSVLPKLSKLKQENDQKYKSILQVYFDIMMWSWILIAIPVSLLSPYLINFMYGSSYEPSSSILSVYIWGQFGTNFGVARSIYLNIENKLRFSLYLSLIGALANIAINYVLIPKLQALGATIATIITYSLVIVILNFVFRDLRFVGSMIVRSSNLYQAVFRIKALVK